MYSNAEPRIVILSEKASKEIDERRKNRPPVENSREVIDRMREHLRRHGLNI